MKIFMYKRKIHEKIGLLKIISLHALGLMELRFSHVMDWHCIFRNHFSHLLNFILQDRNVFIVLFNRVFSLIVFLLKHILLRCYTLQLFRKRLGIRLKLKPFSYQVIELQFVLLKVMLLDLFLSFQFLSVLSQVL